MNEIDESTQADEYGVETDILDLLEKYRLSDDDSPEEHEPSIVRSKPPLARVQIQELSGDSRSLPYSSLLYLDFNASRGIRMIFPYCVIDLEGLHLRPLYDALSEQSVKRVLVLGEFTEETEQAVIVTSCKVTTEKEGIENLA